jgi:hypothetical protein
MNVIDGQRSENDRDRQSSENYFFGCLGAFGLIIGIAEWILRGCPLTWLPHLMVCGLVWTGMISLQLLTLVALRRRLALFHLSQFWLWLLLTLWISFDLPLAVYRHAYFVLPLTYGIAQVFLLLGIPKFGRRSG